MKTLHKIAIIFIALSVIGFFIELIFYSGMLFEKRKYIVQINPRVDLASNTSEYDIQDIKV